MDNFQDIDFDTVQGVTREVRSLTARILGIMDHLDDPSMNDLPDHAQREVKHVTDALDGANDLLLSGVDSWLNAMWHDMPHTEQMQLLSDTRNQAKTLDAEHLRPDAAACICESMMEGGDKERFMIAWNALISHGGWYNGWDYIKEYTGWEDPQEFLEVLHEWHPEAYALINEDEVIELHGDWEDE